MFISLVFINITKGRQSRADMVASGFLGFRLLYPEALPSNGIGTWSMTAGQPLQFRSVFQLAEGKRRDRGRKRQKPHIAPRNEEKDSLLYCYAICYVKTDMADSSS